MKSGFASKIKNSFVRTEKKPRKIRFGLFKNLTFLLDYTYQSQLYFGLWEKEISQWILKLSKDANTAIDVGAGEGEYTLYFIAKTQAKRVIAFEPSVHLREKITDNLKNNRYKQDCDIRILSKYIGEKDYQDQCSLDSLIGQIEPPCIIKVDIDGGELDLLKGAQKLLKLPHISWVIETHSKELERQCIQILKQEKYDVKIINSYWWRIFIPEQRPFPSCGWLVATK